MSAKGQGQDSHPEARSAAPAVARAPKGAQAPASSRGFCLPARGQEDWRDPWASVCVGLGSSCAICTKKPVAGSVKKERERKHISTQDLFMSVHRGFVHKDPKPESTLPVEERIKEQ